jgi:hypothetical protein
VAGAHLLAGQQLDDTESQGIGEQTEKRGPLGGGKGGGEGHVGILSHQLHLISVVVDVY